MVNQTLLVISVFTLGLIVGVGIHNLYIKYKYGALIKFKKASDQEALLKKHLETKQ
jgi:hypothetical protein